MPKGRKLSEEHRRKISEAQLGERNHNFGKHHSLETRKKISDSELGEKHHSWKGDDVGYRSLHDWVRRYLPIPDLCIICFNVPPQDLANLTGIYKREFINWGYMCTRCHVLYDRDYY